MATHAVTSRSVRPVILVTLGTYLPGFRAGGGVRSIAHLVDHLSDAFDFRIVTSDRDLGDERAYPGVELNKWVPVGPALVRYMSPERQMPLPMARFLSGVPYDLLYLNSFFSPRMSIVPLTLRRVGLIPRQPTVIAPKGEFSSGALALKSLKKQSYLAVARATGLLHGLRWHASTDFEARDIRAVIGDGSAVAVARDLVAGQDEMPQAHAPRAPDDPLRIVFVGRISPKKNLDYALKILSLVSAPVRFTICGPEEDAAYARLCRRLAADLPSSISVEWAGTVPPDQVGACFAAHDLLFFPTRGENFGHVIAESLAGHPGSSVGHHAVAGSRLRTH